MTCPTAKIKKAHELLLQLLIWTTKDVLGVDTIKRKTKKYHGIGKVFKPNRKTYKEAKSIPLKHIYMTTHFPGLEQTPQ
jgi:hypothetical protein